MGGEKSILSLWYLQVREYVTDERERIEGRRRPR